VSEEKLVLYDRFHDDYQRVAEVANQIGSMARAAGMVCSWHQHWGTLFERPEAFHALMELTDPELVRFCPDTAQLTMGDFDVLATFRKYARRIGFVHFKDLDVNRPWAITGARGGPSTWSDTGAYHVDSKWRFVEMEALSFATRAGTDLGGVQPLDRFGEIHQLQESCFTIRARQSHQLFMRALVCQASGIEHENHIGATQEA
jgi:hypothetical protein